MDCNASNKPAVASDDEITGDKNSDLDDATYLDESELTNSFLDSVKELCDIGHDFSYCDAPKVVGACINSILVNHGKCINNVLFVCTE